MSATITKTGNIVEYISNNMTMDCQRLAENVVTGKWVVLTNNDVDTNMEMSRHMLINSTNIDTIDTLTHVDNLELYNQLKDLL